MKPLTPARHTVVDVLFCVVMALAPTLLRLGGTPAILCYALAGGYFVFSMLTNTPAAPIRVIPFRVHGAVEIVAGFGLLAAPWLFGFKEVEPAKWLFIGASVITFIVFSLTQWIESPKPVRTGHLPA